MCLHRFLVVDFLLASCPLGLHCEWPQIWDIALGHVSATLRPRDFQIWLAIRTGIARHQLQILNRLVITYSCMPPNPSPCYYQYIFISLLHLLKLVIAEPAHPCITSSIQYHYQCLRNLKMLAKCISGCSMLPIMCILHQKIRETIPISKSRQPDGGISHLECEILLLHIVRGGRGLEALAGKFDPV